MKQQLHVLSIRLSVEFYWGEFLNKFSFGHNIVSVWPGAEDNRSGAGSVQAEAGTAGKEGTNGGYRTWPGHSQIEARSGKTEAGLTEQQSEGTTVIKEAVIINQSSITCPWEIQGNFQKVKNYIMVSSSEAIEYTWTTVGDSTPSFAFGKNLFPLWDLRFPQQCFWRSVSHELWHVTFLVFPDILKAQHPFRMSGNTKWQHDVLEDIIPLCPLFLH